MYKTFTPHASRTLHKSNQIIIGSLPLGVVNRGIVVPLGLSGLQGVPWADRKTFWGSFDEDPWPATFFRGGFIGVCRGCGVFFMLVGGNKYKVVLEGVLTGVLRSRRQRPGTTELLHVASWFSTSRRSYNKYSI